jgi:hypothetical protein
MSELSKEGAGSLLVSAVGAWLGLGAGLALMVLSLLAVTGLVVGKDNLGGPRSLLDRSLGPDVGAVVSKSAELSDDGRTLSLRVWNAEGKEETVVYSVWEDQLTRSSSDGGPRLVARYQEFRFALEGTALSASWRDGAGRKKQNWALERW